MDYPQAYAKVTALAAEGDVSGIQAVIKQAQESGMNPALVMTLGTFTEAAILNIGASKQRRKQ